MSPTVVLRPFSVEKPQPIDEALGCIMPSRWYGASQSCRTPATPLEPPVATSLTNVVESPIAATRSRAE
jgi:hypothetical protein